MTAEVAILNKGAIALAADSAVTTGFPGKEKIFKSANKIFTLSKTEPVGVMSNGHIEHFGLLAEMPYLAEGVDPSGGRSWRCAASAVEAQSMSRTG